MPDLYRVTINFAGRKQGWSESFVIGRDTTDIDTLQAQVVYGLIGKRRDLLAQEYVIDAYRISKIRFANGNVVKRNAQVFTDDKGPDPAITDNKGEQPRDCAVCELHRATGGGRKTIFMRGIPDSIAVDGGTYNPNGAGGWGGRLSAYIQAQATAGCGWLGDEISKQDVLLSGYTQTDNGLITFNFTSAIAEAGDVGKVIRVRFRGINNKSVLNRLLYVRVVDVDTVISMKPYAVFAYQTGGIATSYATTRPFVAQAGTVGVSEIRTHKTGRPSYATRGRLPARAAG